MFFSLYKLQKQRARGVARDPDLSQDHARTSIRLTQGVYEVLDSSIAEVSTVVVMKYRPLFPKNLCRNLAIRPYAPETAFSS